MQFLPNTQFISLSVTHCVLVDLSHCLGWNDKIIVMILTIQICQWEVVKCFFFPKLNCESSWQRKEEKKKTDASVAEIYDKKKSSMNYSILL